MTEWLDIVAEYDGGLYRKAHGDDWEKSHGEGE